MTEYLAVEMGSISAKRLQEYFDQGWEYVDGFSQSVSITSSSYNTSKGEILIILKREKASL